MVVGQKGVGIYFCLGFGDKINSGILVKQEPILWGLEIKLRAYSGSSPKAWRISGLPTYY